MVYVKDEKRKHSRFDFCSTIDYVIEPGTNDEDEVVYKGVIVNISNLGLGAYVFDEFPEGQKIIIRTELPVDSRTATIRWMKKEDPSLYFSGFMFI